MARRVILLGILLAMAVVSLNLGKCLSIYLCAIICVLFCYKVRSNGEKNTNKPISGFEKKQKLLSAIIA